MAASLRDNYDFYLAHKEEIVKDHAFKYVLISDRRVVDSFKTQDEAVAKGQEIAMAGEYLVKYATLEEEQPLQFNHWVRVVGAPQ